MTPLSPAQPTLEPVAIARHRISPEARPGYVHLYTANLERQITFYTRVIGLQVHWQESHSAGLGSGSIELLRLTEKPHGRRYRGVSGLYHFAILLPNRRELARVIARLFALRYPNAPTDHIMTKSTYLSDPEGNGIEIYVESPEDGIFAAQGDVFVARRADGSLSDGREPLDLEALFAHLAPSEDLSAPLPLETRLGHIHLHVGDLEAAMRFYHDQLGFDNMGLMRVFGMGMVSAGGYHHHIGFNIWQGYGAPPAPADALGLRHFTFVLPNRHSLAALTEHLSKEGVSFEEVEEGILMRDPSRNAMILTSAP
jgi:catechol 2,3-dioxygenase